jgi:hypothetical protein
VIGRNRLFNESVSTHVRISQPDLDVIGFEFFLRHGPQESLELLFVNIFVRHGRSVFV